MINISVLTFCMWFLMSIFIVFGIIWATSPRMSLNEGYMFVDMDKAVKVSEAIEDFPLWYSIVSKTSIIMLHYADKNLQKMFQRLDNNTEAE